MAPMNPSRILLAMTCCTCVTLVAGARAFAGEEFFRLPAEQRQQIRQQMRDHWQNCSQEEGKQRPEGKERWSPLAPDERRRLRSDMAAQSSALLPDGATKGLDRPPRHARPYRPPSTQESD